MSTISNSSFSFHAKNRQRTGLVWVSKTKEKTTGYIRADATTCRPDQGNFIPGSCKKQVSAANSFVRREQDQREKRDTYGLIVWFVGEMSRIQKQFWRHAKMQVSAKHWSSWARPWEKTGIRTYWTVEIRTISGPVFVHADPKIIRIKSWSRWARPDGKHRDTYFLKRWYTRDFGSVFGFSMSKIVSKWQWSAWARPKGKIWIHTNWSGEARSNFNQFSVLFVPKIISKQRRSDWAGPRSRTKEKTGIRTYWTVEIGTISGPVFVHADPKIIRIKSWSNWARPVWKHRDTYSLKRWYTRDFNSKNKLVKATVCVRKTKGYVRAEVPKSRQFGVKYWYISKRKSSANRDGPAEQDQGGKHRDTYFLKRRYTRDFGSVFGFRCQKKLVNGNGLHEQDQHKNKRIRTSWSVDTREILNQFSIFKYQK